MLPHSSLRRGFTLIELMSAVVILTVLATLALTVRVYGLGRARVNNAVFDVAALFSTAQLQALRSGVPHYLVLQQPADGRVRITLLERPDAQPAIAWDALDLSQGPEAALAFQRTRPDGTSELSPATVRDRLTLGGSAGMDAGGLAFLDLDSPRLRRPLPPPFHTTPLTTPSFTPVDLHLPTRELLGGCSFCVGGAQPYGVIRFNPDGTVRLETGGVETGGTLALMPNTPEESRFAPRLLTIAAPAGAVRVF
ncbi:pilus assembly FimT family protein [Hyalangium rubrum]|uniref:Prepilin-type N-terminal cleavage/methylation domain-containing protein n=1 Tax=Hyalangium rubrum TaxID=3103134 RepID=A0ABU5HFF4_9BACT|nr:prepilin-type N-terminal cleavage/methylation domain-containing protein [Hyalangium sp. s54d21]MDY7231976.1 prepilin-type N-terminal cleavage/methylation domain-containing protein [Hyalangium sp. s54d21]